MNNNVYENLLIIITDASYLEEFKLLMLARLNALQGVEVFKDARLISEKVVYYKGVEFDAVYTNVILVDVYNDKMERERILNVYEDDTYPEYRYKFIDQEDWFTNLLNKSIRMYKIDKLLD